MSDEEREKGVFMKLKKVLIVVLVATMAFSFAGCGKTKNDEGKDSILMTFAKEALQDRLVDGRLDYSLENYWYQTGNEYDVNKIDVFYALSTTLISAKDKDGKQSFYSTLSDEDRQIMQGEYEYMSTEMFDSEHFNFIAPYYRQMTFETYKETDKKVVLPAMITAITDICDAFDYYMEHQNNGRPFIIAGFSQGGVMTQALLMHMTDQQYSQLIAAYSMGFQVAEKELSMDHIKVATGEDDLGVLVSYNSVASTDTMWDQIEGSAAACINPLNWKTDDTPATLEYNGDVATVHIDKEKQVLVVEGLDSEKYDGMGYPIAKGVYHMWDIRFYAKDINANAIHRAELKAAQGK